MNLQSHKSSVFYALQQFDFYECVAINNLAFSKPQGLRLVGKRNKIRHSKHKIRGSFKTQILNRKETTRNLQCKKYDNPSLNYLLIK